MSERSCPVSGGVGGRCPAGNGSDARLGPRGCAFSGYSQAGDVRAAFKIPPGTDTGHWLRMRDRRAINEILYANTPSIRHLNATIDNKNIDTLPADDHDLLAVALGAPARQVILRAEEIGPSTGWKDGFLTSEYGFVPPDLDEHAAALAASPGRIWSDLAERMPGCVARGHARESMAALPLVEGTEEFIPDEALWGALVVLGLLCSIYRYEDKHEGREGITVTSKTKAADLDIDNVDVLEEVKGIPKCIGLPYVQVSKRMGRAIPHLTFVDQSSYNVKVRDPKSREPYVHRFENIDLRWPMFGDQSEIAFLKGCAETSASFQHGPDAIANCQEHVMNRNIEGLLREMIRLKEILERMPNAFHSISPNPGSGDNYVPADEWVRWAKMSAPLSKRCPASSGLQFPPYLLMDAFLGRKKYDSFLGKEGVHLRAWQPSNLRAFIAAVEYHYPIPEFCQKSGDPRLIGVLDGIIEAYTGERGFMGVHRYKVFGILEVAAKTGRQETNGNSGKSGQQLRPWEETHIEFSTAMKERLEPYRGSIDIEPHEMRGTFAECRYKSNILSRSFIDDDPARSLAMITFDLQDTGVTFQPGDRLAIMPLNTWDEVAKVALALGLEDLLDEPVELTPEWVRFATHLGSVNRQTAAATLTVRDILRRGHLAPLTEEVILKVHNLLRATSGSVLQALATEEWPIRGTLGDLLQAAVVDTPEEVWDKAFSLDSRLLWLADLVTVEVPRTYSISSFPDELLPSTVTLTVARAEYEPCDMFRGQPGEKRAGVGSGFLNPPVSSNDEMVMEDDVLIGVSRPVAFQLPLNGAAPCAFFAGGSGIAPFRSFWQARLGNNSVGRNILYLGVQSREKFCYEQELRDNIATGRMEVHVAFSRDSRGLAFNRQSRSLVEQTITPRYIDSLIVEQRETICELVLSKKQGGLGGYLYVCGSVSVFDSVMAGIKKAIYDGRTGTMESADAVIATAFAERRIMLDIFMTPKPLPCRLTVIPQSQLALHTGHRSEEPRTWIGVHGKVYDITDFAPMHPGGTLIIKSNAGVDCSKTFDNLAHTTNPEVKSLLAKYLVGQLAPKPDFRGTEDLSTIYDLWLDYLRGTVETLVAQHFEMNKFVGVMAGSAGQAAVADSTTLWFHGANSSAMLNIKGVRSFYQYQSRLLQGGFSALFGPKFQELVLQLSFSLANAAPAAATTKFPDVLGIIGRAKASEDAVKVSKQVSLIGEMMRSGDSVRFHERGIIAYAARSTELDMGLLEDIRQEACNGMDALESLADVDADAGADVAMTLSTLLMQSMERMAKRLEIFYSHVAQLNIYNAEIEKNPAKTRWHILRQRIRDGSFFLLAQDSRAMGSNATPAYVPAKALGSRVDFDHVFTQIKQSMADAPKASHIPSSTLQNLQTINAVRTSTPVNGMSALESHENTAALDNMSRFINRNMRAIRRLSKMPVLPAGFDITKAMAGQGMPSPPSSRGSSQSPTGRVRRVEDDQLRGLPRQPYNMDVNDPALPGLMALSTRSPPTPPLDASAAISMMMMQNPNIKSRTRLARSASVAAGTSKPNVLQQRTSMIGHMRGLSGSHAAVRMSTSGSSVAGGSLKSFKLDQRLARRQPQEMKVAPTF